MILGWDCAFYGTVGFIARPAAMPFILADLLLQTLGLGFLKIKPQLAKSGCLRRVDSRLQIGFFQEVTPAGASVFLALAPFEIIESPLRALRSFHNGHDPT
jgi:hypothetical protein